MQNTPVKFEKISAMMLRKPTIEEVGRFVKHPELVQQVDERTWAVPFFEPMHLYLVCFVNLAGHAIIAASKGYISHSTKSVVLTGPIPLCKAIQDIKEVDPQFAQHTIDLFEDEVQKSVVSWGVVDF